MAGNEIRDLLIKVKTEGGKEAFKLMEDIEKKVKTGINGGLMKTNKNLNTIGATIKRRIKDFDELRKAAKGTSSMGSSSSDKALKAMSHNLKNVAESANDTNQSLKLLTKQMQYQIAQAEVQESILHDSADAFDDYTRAAKGAAKGNTKFGNGMKHNNKKGRGQAKMFSSLASSGGGLVGMYASLAASLFIVDSAFRALKVSADLTRLEENIAALGNGRNLRAFAVELQETAAGALSVDAALRLAAQSSALGFKSDEMQEMTKMARKASVALGIDFTDALHRVTKGIAKQEVELLDELGVVTRLEPAMKKYAANLGKTVQQLTDAERKQALYIETMKQMRNAYGSVNAESTEFEKIQANLGTIATAVGKVIADKLTPAVQLLNWVIKDTVEELNLYDAADGALSAGQTAKGIVANANAASGSAEQLASLGQTILELSAEYKRLESASNFYYDSTEDQEKVYKALTKAQSKFNALVVQSQVNLIASNGAMSDAVINLEAMQKGYAETSDKITNFSASAKAGLVDYQTQLEHAAQLVVNLNGLQSDNTEVHAEGLKLQSQYLDNINKSYGTAFNSVQEYLDAWKAASETSTGFEEANKLIKAQNWSLLQSTTLRDKMVVLDARIAAAQKLNLDAEVKKLNAIKTSLKYETESVVRAEKRNKLDTLSAFNQSYALAHAKARGYEESEILGLQITSLNDRISAEADLLTGLERQALTRERDLLVQQKQLTLAKEQRELSSAKDNEKVQLGKLDADIKGKPASVSATLDVVAATQNLEIAEQYGNELQQQLATTKLLIAMRKAEVAVAKESHQFSNGGEASAALTGGFGNQDLATNAANKEIQGPEGEDVMQHGVDGVNSALEALQSLDSAMGSITGGFMQMGQIMAQSMKNGEFGADAAAASIGAVQQIMSGQSQQAVTEIDHQIAMEKKRDGQSAKSVAKLKELEKKKLKEQQKAKLQSAIMSTAAGIASALELPFPYNLVAAGITGVMGLAQVSAIRSQGKNASALNAAGPKASSIEFGSRMNNVDVSQGASAGERAFVTGSAGTGTTANNFVGAAAGDNNVSAGTAINVGERGAEVFIPDVPGSIVPSGNSSSGKAGSSVKISLNVDNIDAQSFIDRKDDLMEAVDEAIRAKFGRSLEDL